MGVVFIFIFIILILLLICIILLLFGERGSTKSYSKKNRREFYAYEHDTHSYSVRKHSADEYFEVQDMVNEIKDNIFYIKQMGYMDVLVKELGAEMIDTLTKGTNKSHLSRLYVTDEFDIILPDYEDMEIKLTPLPKAVYILFLRHPEGIRFGELPEYKKELLEIYKYISKKESLEELMYSIDAVTDPFSNSINEKRSRIREAFVAKLNDNIVEYYYITGLKGESKKIILDRELVHLPKVIHRISLSVGGNKKVSSSLKDLS